MIHRGTKKADAILAIIEYIHDTEIDYFVKPYVNGREKGWNITNMGKNGLIFCEGRNHDGIVIYEQKSYYDELTDKAYENAKGFGSESFKEAAQYILARLEA